MQHTVTLEPLTADLRRAAALQSAPHPLAVVERTDGHLVRVCGTFADSDTGRDVARSYARTLGATFDDANSVPVRRPLLARLAAFLGRNREAAPITSREAERAYERGGIGFFTF
ncbi:hypothetical protein [Amycolatopsis sp. NPDC051372]|uniref:hypothetical protein n=1 Tax=Amycolatopsis sp. NPDC051372 TaxID=3155669 RepID=UPI00341C6FE5